MGPMICFIDTSVLVNAKVKGKKLLLQRDEARIQVQDLAHHRLHGGSRLGHVERYQLQGWDAMVLEAALSKGTNTLCSEDFQHGQRFGGVTVVNRFL